MRPIPAYTESAGTAEVVVGVPVQTSGVRPLNRVFH